MSLVDSYQVAWGRRDLPKGLRILLQFLEEEGYPLSGMFELEPQGPGELAAWFGVEPDAVGLEVFLPFGVGASGDFFAIWLLRERRSIDEQPIVFFGSEGTHSVLANDFVHFCMLLCLGHNELGLEPLNDRGRCFEDIAGLRRYLERELGFVTPANGKAIQAAAAQACPEFSRWLGENVQGYDGYVP